MIDRPRLRDLGLFTVGFALAARSIRRAMADAGPPDVARGTISIFVAGWVGLAIAGPWILIHRRGRPAEIGRHEKPGRRIGIVSPTHASLSSPEDLDGSTIDRRLSVGEAVWIALGAYYLTISLPTGLPINLGVCSPTANGIVLLVALASRAVRSRQSSGCAAKPRWTDEFAGGLIWSMPLMWVGTWILSLPS